jgi:hypothetical protein
MRFIVNVIKGGRAMAKLGDLQEWYERGYRDNLPPDRFPVDYRSQARSATRIPGGRTDDAKGRPMKSTLD